MITTMDSDLLTELINTLADARVALDSAILRLPDNEGALRESMESTIRDIDAIRVKAPKPSLEKDRP